MATGKGARNMARFAVAINRAKERMGKMKNYKKRVNQLINEKGKGN
jgi:hypothetical protein